MKRAGFFSDRPLSLRVGLDVRNHLGKLDLTVQSLVAGYLAGGARYMTVLDPNEPDVVDPHLTVTIGALTDGEWLWPTDYAHYVRMYAAEVPQEFVAKIKSLNGVCPEVTKDGLSQVSKEFRAWANATDPSFAKAQLRGPAR